jgi:hypothetical protein
VGSGTLALCLDDRRCLVGTALVAVGWVQHTHLSVRPILLRIRACHASSCVIDRYGHYWGLGATELVVSSERWLYLADESPGL